MLTREAIKGLCLEHNLEMVVLFGSRGLRPIATGTWLCCRYLLELTQILEASQAEFESDFRIHRVAERQIELLVECAASINSEVAQAVAQIPPSDYYSSFHSMAATGRMSPNTW